MEVRYEPEGTPGERSSGPDRRVRGLRRAALRLGGDAALDRRMGVHGYLFRLRPGDHAVDGPRRPRAPGRAAVLPDTGRTAALGQGVYSRDHVALCAVACPDAPGRREVRVVGGARLATDRGSHGPRALVLHRVPDLQGERVSRPRGETAGGEGPDRR